MLKKRIHLSFSPKPGQAAEAFQSFFRMDRYGEDWKEGGRY
jgi:hypothetical protein